MTKGGIYLGGAAVAVALAACSSGGGKLAIRAIPTPVAQDSRPVPARIAEARGHFQLGNVALALESFRKAFRDDPQSVDALNGMAACYDRMGRFDLSRRYYETALAIAPGDPRLYANLATSLAMQGRTEEAAAVRRELQQRLAAVAPTNSTEPVAIAEVKVPDAVAAMSAPAARGKVEVALAPARPNPLAAPVAPVATPVRLVDAAPVLPVKAAAIPAAAAAAKPVEAPAPVMPKAPAVATLSDLLAPSTWVPQLASVAPPKAVLARAVPAEPAESAAARPWAAPALAEASGPRIERTSPSEVALVTTTRPVWKARVVERTGRSTTIAFNRAPVRNPAQAVVLLNAARVQGLAARTRSWLGDRGWRQLAIGNARRPQQRSVILYPPERRRLAQRLARQFGFVMKAQRTRGGQVTILLGRDAAGHRAFRIARG